MIEKLDEINLNHFSFDYFKRNDRKKCIEISNYECFEPVDRFILYIDHIDCKPGCFVNEKISKTEIQLSNVEKFDTKSVRDNNRYIAIVTAKNIQSVYEIYLQLCLTERCLLLPICTTNTDKEVKLHNEQCAAVNITDLLTADCWLHIFSYLHLNDLFQLSAVSTDFLTLVQHYKKIKSLRNFHFQFFDKYFEVDGEEIVADKSVSKMTDILQCIGHNLEEVSISVGRTSNEIRIFETLIRHIGTKLHTLRLRNFCWLSMIFEIMSGRMFSQIKTLQLDSQYYDIPISVDIKAKFPNLEKLQLQGRWKLVEFTNWSGITELTLDRIISLNHYSWMTWMTDVAHHFRNLQTLSVCDTIRRTVPLENVDCLLQLEKLRSIQIEIINLECFDVVLKLNNLISVSLTFYKSIQEVIDDKLHQLACCLPNLQQFDLTLKEEAFLPRDDLTQFVALAHRLKGLHLINDTIKIFLFIAPSFLQEILDARKQSQGVGGERDLLLIAFTKCFIDEKVFKEASGSSFREFIVLKNNTRAY
ncbi:hypothetical protein Bhyg_08885 [Pseudolycoriella hygida]|uniref:F-box domain-containing protein n=1 Tax=Pseudolycoriella hygida TaxID=35572 RepID=A0A9Q0S5D6_9DIPT|nr:hypothetical protein Bhyg_08885 [Pseudolycoriella hygida]